MPDCTTIKRINFIKKTFITIAGLTILTLFIIVTVKAQSNDPKTSKVNSEIKKDVPDGATTAICPGMSGKKISGRCSGGCSSMNCDSSKCKEGKCDPAACKCGNCDQANCANSKCGQGSQKPNCGRTAAGMMSGPMNCARDMVVAAK